MGEHCAVRGIYYNRNGEIWESPTLKGDNGAPVSGTILTTSGERIPFFVFHAYTTVEGFAAYVDNGGNKVLINCAHIQRILLNE